MFGFVAQTFLFLKHLAAFYTFNSDQFSVTEAERKKSLVKQLEEEEGVSHDRPECPPLVPPLACWALLQGPQGDTPNFVVPLQLSEECGGGSR